MSTRWGLRLAAVTTACACCAAAAHAQAVSPRPATATPAADDMAMPDDLGAPLAGAPAQPAAAPGRSLSVNSPIAAIAADPQGRAALERQLPGLCERPEYPMFKSLSLKRLAGMSSGRITEAKLDAVQADLSRLGPVDAADAAPHRTFLVRTTYPLVHTAGASIHYGGKQIGRFSRSLYHRVVLVVASL